MQAEQAEQEGAGSSRVMAGICWTQRIELLVGTEEVEEEVVEAEVVEVAQELEMYSSSNHSIKGTEMGTDSRVRFQVSGAVARSRLLGRRLRRLSLLDRSQLLRARTIRRDLGLYMERNGWRLGVCGGLHASRRAAWSGLKRTGTIDYLLARYGDD